MLALRFNAFALTRTEPINDLVDGCLWEIFQAVHDSRFQLFYGVNRKQQDGARAHTSKMSLDYRKARVLELWELEQWPSNSPDLNPKDYGSLGPPGSTVYLHPIHSAEELKARIV